MPIKTYSSQDAYAQYRDNPLSTWPERGGPRDRFSPRAAPGFVAGTRLIPGERVFTIGSCFARHVETELERHGFDIPPRRFTVDPAYWSGEATTLLNNYAVPAILPQIRWAFGMGEAFSLEKHCVGHGGKYQDLQIAANIRPQPAEVVLAQRERISAIYRELSGARVVVLTLGLVEAWWDDLAKMYINMAPPKRAVRADPDRFSLHVLDFEDVSRGLYDLMDLLAEVCPDDLRVVMTVSPVPLTATFTDQDVAVANSYSKAVLRAAVDHVRARHDFVSYFPSFESFMLTRKDGAFVKDQVHPRNELVGFNIARMVQTYLGREGPGNVLDEAEQARKSGNLDKAIGLLRRALETDPTDAAVRGALARILTNMGRMKAARDIAFHPAGDRDPDTLVARAKIHYRDADFAAAAAAARGALDRRPAFKAGLLNLALALIAAQQTDEAARVMQRLLAVAQTAQWRASAWMLKGLIHEAEGHPAEAVADLEKALGFQNQPVIRQHLKRVMAAV